MSKAVSVINAAISSDATLRTWGAAINAAMTAQADITQTADTGQINWTTVTKPTAANTLIGYEIWRFNDALQSTSPIFWKIAYYSSGNTSGNNFHLRVQVGQGSNGSGALTGAVTDATTATESVTGQAGNDTAASTQTGQIMRICTLPGYIFFQLSAQSGSNIWGQTYPAAFTIMRTIDSSTGLNTGNGVYFYATRFISVAMAARAKCINLLTNTYSSIDNDPNAGVPSDLSNYDSGDQVIVLPHYASLTAPHLVNGILNVRYDSPGLGGEFDCELGGVSHHYLIVAALGTPWYPVNMFGLNAYNNSVSNVTNEQLYLGAAVIWE